MWSFFFLNHILLGFLLPWAPQEKKTYIPHLQREHEMSMLPMQPQRSPVEPLVSQNSASGPEIKSHLLRQLPVARGRDSIKAAARWRQTTGANVRGFSQFSSVQFSRSVVSDSELQHSSFPVPHQLPEFTQTHVHRVGDAIQPSHPLLSPSPPASSSSQSFPVSQLFA